MSVSENKGVFMNIALCGIHGAMGKILKDEIEQSGENKLVGYFSPRNGITGQDISEKIDVIIDFSRPENIDFLLDYALKNRKDKKSRRKYKGFTIFKYKYRNKHT